MTTSSTVLLILLPLSLVGGEVRTGDSIDGVLTAMGTPRGRLQIGSRERLCFDRGEVEVSAGVVTSVALRSEEAQVALETKRTADALRAREEHAINQARLIAEGEALKTRKLSDPGFQATPLKYQVAFWEDFSRRYPAVPCLDQLSVTRARIAEQVKSEQMQAQRLAELEARIAEAQARAAEANARAARDRDYYPACVNSSDYYRGFADYHQSGRASTHYDNAVMACRSDASRPAPSNRDDRSQFSSHTASAFSGQDWLVWPSPTQPRR